MARFIQYPVKAELVLEESLRPEETKLDKYWQPLGEPVRQVPFVFAAIFAAGLTFVGEPDDFAVPYDPSDALWNVSLSEPVRVQPPLPVGAYPYWVMDIEALGDAEAITPDKWFAPLNDPILPLRIEAAFENPYFFHPRPILLVTSGPASDPFTHIFTAENVAVTFAAENTTRIFGPENVTETVKPG